VAHNISMNIQIKKVSFSKAARVLFDLDNKIFTRSYHRKYTNLETFKRDYKNCSVLMVFNNDTPIGLAVFEKKGESTEIFEFGCLPRYQNKGIGKVLLEAFLKEVETAKVHLLTNPRNTPAIVFYLKHGFILSAWKDNYYENGQPRVLLVRE
jgi:ribosomal protein S18 acetylase RimI-like enzyme